MHLWWTRWKGIFILFPWLPSSLILLSIIINHKTNVKIHVPFTIFYHSIHFIVEGLLYTKINIYYCNVLLGLHNLLRNDFVWINKVYSFQWSNCIIIIMRKNIFKRVHLLHNNLIYFNRIKFVSGWQYMVIWKEVTRWKGCNGFFMYSRSSLSSLPADN